MADQVRLRTFTRACWLWGFYSGVYFSAYKRHNLTQCPTLFKVRFLPLLVVVGCVGELCAVVLLAGLKVTHPPSTPHLSDSLGRSHRSQITSEIVSIKLEPSRSGNTVLGDLKVAQTDKEGCC